MRLVPAAKLAGKQFKLVEGNYGSVQIPEITGTMEKQTMLANGGEDIEVKKNGYLYVYVSNESKGSVFFDNLAVTHIRGPILEETHYYPFGLTMTGISSKALEGENYPENKKKYNGIDKEDDLGLEVYDAQLRELDGQTGRWWQIDPKTDDMEMWSPYASNYNNPILNSDPLGDEPEACCGFLTDIVDGFVDKAKGTWHAVTNPKETIKSMFSVEGLTNNFLNVVTYGTYGDVKTLTTDGPGKFIGGKLFDGAAYVVTDGIAKGVSVKLKPGEIKIPETNTPEVSLGSSKPRNAPAATGVPNSSKIEAKDASGKTTKYSTYDQNGNLVKQVEAARTVPRHGISGATKKVPTTNTMPDGTQKPGKMNIEPATPEETPPGNNKRN